MEMESIILIILGLICILGGFVIISKIVKSLCAIRKRKMKSHDTNYHDQELGQLSCDKEETNFQTTMNNSDDNCRNSKTKFDNNVPRFTMFVGTKGGNPSQKNSKKESRTNMDENESEEDEIIFSSNRNTPERHIPDRVFQTKAQIHSRPSDQNEKKINATKRIRKQYLPRDNVVEDEIDVVRDDNSFNDTEISIVNDKIDTHQIMEIMKEQKLLQNTEFICAFPKCAASYTRKFKLQKHLSDKHGLSREDQELFYGSLPESSIDLSPKKPGPKTYIPPKFACPKQNCESIFSRKYDLQKHLRKCDKSLLDSPEVKRMKDSVLQHCKMCDKVIKGGHLANHKRKCAGNQEDQCGTIVTKNDDRTPSNEIQSSSDDDQHENEDIGSSKSSLKSEESQNPLDKKIDKYSSKRYIKIKAPYTPSKSDMIKEATRKVVNAILKKQFLDNPDEFTENPIEKYSNTTLHKTSRNFQSSGDVIRKGEESYNKPSSSQQSTLNLLEGNKRKNSNSGNLKIKGFANDSSEEENKKTQGAYEFRNRNVTLKGNDMKQQYVGEEQSDTTDESSVTLESWNFNQLEHFSDSTLSIDSKVETFRPPDNVIKVAIKGKGKSVVGKKSLAKNKKEDIDDDENDDEKSSYNTFDPNIVPDFLSLPNDDVSHVYLEKEFEEWNIAYTNWFVNKDKVASRTSNMQTIRGYLSELCRYGKYTHDRMKERSIDWNLGDILLFNKRRGSTFNTTNGVTFFEDPSQYMLHQNMPLSRKLKFLMSLVHAVEMIASTIIAGQDGCTLTIEECASRESALMNFKDKILKQYSAISSSNFCHRQEDRLAIHQHRGNEMPSKLVKEVLNIWIYSNKRQELYAKLFNLAEYLKKFCDDQKYPCLDIEKESLGFDKWSQNDIIRIRSSQSLAHYLTDLRSLLELEILSLGIGHRSQVVANIQIKDLILPSLIEENGNTNLVISNVKMKSKYGLLYTPINQTTFQGCLVYLRFIRTIYQGHYKSLEDWSTRSLFVSHSKNSKDLVKPCQSLDVLLKEAVAEENSHLLTGKYHWSLVDLRRQAASYLTESKELSSETKEISSHLMHHSTAIRNNTYSSIPTMQKIANEFKDGINNWITDGKELPVIPTLDQSQFLQKSKQDLTEEFKRKDEATRMEKHRKMASTGRQFLQKDESNWLWQFWSMNSIKERWAKRDEENKPSKRELLREFMREFHVFELIVQRLLERKTRHNENANINDVVDTIISSYKSFKSHSRF